MKVLITVSTDRYELTGRFRFHGIRTDLGQLWIRSQIIGQMVDKYKLNPNQITIVKYLGS